MRIKVLGPGCKNCEVLHEMTLQAVEDLAIADATIEYVKDMNEITKYIMATPGLVVDEVVVHEGKPLPNLAQVKKMLSAGSERKGAGGCGCGCSCGGN